MSIDIKIKLLYDGSRLPEYVRKGDGALDFFACIDNQVKIPAGKWVTIPTGVALEVPEDHGLFILPRSGLTIKHGITVANTPGLVDSNYRGEVKVVLHNRSREVFTVYPDARIAQMTIIKLPKVNWVVVDELSETVRGANGFGSSGV
jgi:dUTP pyrophosphatase